MMKILAVHSFAVHGTASLKAMMSLLGTRLLPVPSLYLSGLTNIPGHYKSAVEMKQVLKSSLEIAAQRQEQLLLFVGYLSSAQQVEEILPLLDQYAAHIQALIVDPVCGDHGRKYVPDEVVQAWPRLLKRANWALPNFTEIQLLSNLPASPAHLPETYLQAFQDRFPQLSFIATSVPHAEQLELRLWDQGQRTVHLHERLHPHYGGTGDVFASYFLYHHFFQQQAAATAMKAAAQRTLEIIRTSIQAGSQDLIIAGGIGE